MNMIPFTRRLAMLALAAVAFVPMAARADVTPPNELIKTLSTQVLDAAKQDKAIQAGDLKKITALVDATVMPHVNFERMTKDSMSGYWSQASADQKKRLQDEFKQLLIRTYAVALANVGDRTVQMKRLRARPEDTDVVVKAEVVGGGASEPIAMQYKLEKQADGWKIYDVNFAGSWLTVLYQDQFAKDLAAGGVDALLATLTKINRGGAVAQASKK